MMGRPERTIAAEPKAHSAGDPAEDTVEISLTSAQQLELWRIADSESRTRMTGTFMPSHDAYICRRSARIDTAATLCFAVVVLSITIAVGWHGLAGQPAVSARAPVASIVRTRTTQDSPQSPMIQVTNPFDATEVFELPAAISAASVQDAIADLLLQRARERIRLGIVPYRVRSHHRHPASTEDGQRDVVVTRLFGANTVASLPAAAPGAPQ
ncbi:MAG TPA: hypothetical protein VGI91_11920 [Steroidobacteraceae bacterium]|jgi:hypothetical protein